MHICTKKHFNLTSVEHPSSPHPLTFLRPITSKAIERLILSSGDTLCTKFKDYIGIHGTNLSSVATLARRGVLQPMKYGAAEASELYFFPRKEIIVGPRTESIGLERYTDTSRLLSHTKVYAMIREKEDRFVRLALTRCADAGVAVTPRACSELFDRIWEDDTLELCLSDRNMPVTVKEEIKHLVCVIAQRDDPMKAYDRLRSTFSPWRDENLGYLVFFRPSLLESFPIYDAAPDDGFCVRAPRGIGVEHIAGVQRADGYSMTSIKDEMKKALAWCKLDDKSDLPKGYKRPSL